MEIMGINVLELALNPTGALVAAASGVVLVQLYGAINAIFRPVRYISKLYSVADKIILTIDNRIISIYCVCGMI